MRPLFSHRTLADGTVEFDLLGPWSREAAAAFEQCGADSLNLNYALGFTAPSLEFLAEVRVSRLKLLTYESYDLEPINRLGQTLIGLSLGHVSGRVDMSRLCGVVDLSCSWSSVAESLVAATSIRRLYLGDYESDDLAPLVHMSELASLRLSDRPRLRELSGVERLEALESLVIQGARVTALDPVSANRILRKLSIEACAGVSDLGPLENLTSLEDLDISDCRTVGSVGPLSPMTELTTLMAGGSTLVGDGDLTPLLGLGNLSALCMRDRRSYSPSVAAVRQRLGITG